jgi:hypothetical protein
MPGGMRKALRSTPLPAGKSAETKLSHIIGNIRHFGKFPTKVE